MRIIILACGFAAIVFVQVLALSLDSVGVYQLNASYFCKVTATEEQHQAQCRNELDGFGFLTVLPAQGTDYLTHRKELHR